MVGRKGKPLRSNEITREIRKKIVEYINSVSTFKIVDLPAKLDLDANIKNNKGIDVGIINNTIMLLNRANYIERIDKGIYKLLQVIPAEFGPEFLKQERYF